MTLEYSKSEIELYNHLSWSQSSFQHMSCFLLKAWDFPLEHEAFIHLIKSNLFFHARLSLFLHIWSNLTYISVLGFAFIHLIKSNLCFHARLSLSLHIWSKFNLRFYTRLSFLSFFKVLTHFSALGYSFSNSFSRF